MWTGLAEFGLHGGLANIWAKGSTNDLEGVDDGDGSQAADVRGKKNEASRVKSDVPASSRPPGTARPRS